MPHVPDAPDPDWPRYSATDFPSYKYVPGRAPHPRRDPGGHMFGLEEELPPPIEPEEWRTCDEYLYGIDCYNHAYWWEAHEALEGLWKAVGKYNEMGQFLQGVIQIAAANLNVFMDRDKGAERLFADGLARLKATPSPYMGVDVEAFVRDVEDYRDCLRTQPALIALDR